MHPFSHIPYFDLTNFAHSSLFREDEPLWLVLPKIKSYLSAFSFEILGEVEAGAHLVHPELISIGPGSKVEAGATIYGPCIIGSNCEVRQGAYIRGNLIAGNHCVIGHATEVKNALFLDHAHAAHFAYVGDTILGNRVNLGAGVKCANLRFDGKNISISHQDTGLRKCGAFIGDDVQIGCNAVTNPGTFIGKKSFCFPCLNIHGIIPEGTLVKSQGAYT